MCKLIRFNPKLVFSRKKKAFRWGTLRFNINHFFPFGQNYSSLIFIKTAIFETVRWILLKNFQTSSKLCDKVKRGREQTTASFWPQKDNGLEGQTFALFRLRSHPNPLDLGMGQRLESFRRAVLLSASPIINIWFVHVLWCLNCSFVLV